MVRSVVLQVGVTPDGLVHEASGDVVEDDTSPGGTATDVDRARGGTR